MNKPKLSFWQIWNLSFGFLGVQIGYSLQNSNTSSIFESLGDAVSHLSYFWLAAPIAGMIVQPIIGLFSDGTWTRLGRRIPYILGGSIISTLALALMPNCPRLLAFAPLAMGAFILLFMDLSFNVTMQPFRALVAALGGRENILRVDNCLTRLRVWVRDPERLDEKALHSLAPDGLGCHGREVQLVFGFDAEQLRRQLDELLEKNALST